MKLWNTIELFSMQQHIFILTYEPLEVVIEVLMGNFQIHFTTP